MTLDIKSTLKNNTDMEDLTSSPDTELKPEFTTTEPTPTLEIQLSQPRRIHLSTETTTIAT
jgi:hypothetical protein